ncbi:hypothetical protein [Flavobacterium sp. W21_SRS_FM6]|uniref:hypothetical protein n=1 Tax=Flavobacterium sp. W21_SRS_FM6 TaxID=3240268 RepID=UPI003F9083BD
MLDYEWGKHMKGFNLSITSRAVALSALAFPGAGHYYLKHKKTATLLLLVTGACVIKIAMVALNVANLISDRLLKGQIALDIPSISLAVKTELAAQSDIFVSLSTWLLLACWLFGILDAYRLAQAATKMKQVAEN